MRILQLGLLWSYVISMTAMESHTSDAEDNIHTDMINYDGVACSYYMASSAIPGAGRGIFTNIHINLSGLVEESPTLTISSAISSHWTLNDYIYASDNENRSLVAFGMAMLYNHQPLAKRNVFHLWGDYSVNCEPETTSPFSTSTHIGYYANKELKPGEELLTNYGDDDWFELRNLSMANSSTENTSTNDEHLSQPVEYLAEHGVCLSFVYVSNSSLPMAGRGLFAAKNFKEGELIYVSPVLLLPKQEVFASGQDSVLMNYVIAPLTEVDVAIFPLGLTAIANHQSSMFANMRYGWDNRSFEILNNDPLSIFNTAYAPLDLAYYATRDISAHEELTFDYGEAWINAWALYLASTHHSYLDEDTGDILKFRYPIDPIPGLIPSAWNDVTCMGLYCPQSIEVEV